MPQRECGQRGAWPFAGSSGTRAQRNIGVSLVPNARYGWGAEVCVGAD